VNCGPGGILVKKQDEQHAKARGARDDHGRTRCKRGRSQQRRDDLGPAADLRGLLHGTYSAAALTEWNEACTEKLAAGLAGSVAAVTAWNAMLIGSAFQPLTPMAFAHGAMKVFAEASGPAHARVRANAARLSRGQRG
jgi:hypothetical protein